MAESIFYFRGAPPSGEVDGTLLADLNVIAGLRPEQVQGLSNAMCQATGFLHPSALRDRINGVLLDDIATKSVSRALRRIDPDDVDGILRKADEWRKSGKAGILLDDEKIANLRRNLPALIVPYPALARFEKAERLSSLTGKRLESAAMVCDLRPIFDKSGKNVDGMMPYTRLRIIATGADGLPCEFEVELTLEQVHQLATTSRRAKKKLATLLALVTSFMPDGLPEVPLTQFPKEAGEDGGTS